MLSSAGDQSVNQHLNSGNWIICDAPAPKVDPLAEAIMKYRAAKEACEAASAAARDAYAAYTEADRLRGVAGVALSTAERELVEAAGK